ncbi:MULTISPECIES: hypothetical protein [unclassified Arthrobacter]|uniref:hypothetical protein n=1 Tax=unclassified Arthrobacter TaxID=235627 RepID=UPI003395A98D
MEGNLRDDCCGDEARRERHQGDDAIFQLSKRRALTSLPSDMPIRAIMGRMQWLFTLTGHRDPQAQCAEHLSLCQAIYDGKPDLAAALAFAHVELGREPSLQKLAGRLPKADRP